MALEQLLDSFQEQTFQISLVYLPQHMFLWAFLPSEICYIRRHPFSKYNRSTKDYMLTLAKCILNVAMIIIVLSNFGRLPIHFLTRAIETLSYLIPLTLVPLGDYYNVRDHTYLLSFWTLDFLINCFRVVEAPSLKGFVLVSPLLAMLILSIHSSVTQEKHCRSVITPNLLRSIYFSWFDEINRKLHTSCPTEELGDLEREMRATILMRQFRGDSSYKGQYEMVATGESETPVLISIRSLLKPFMKDFVISAINRLALTILFFVCPFLLRQILRINHNSADYESHFYVIGIFTVSLLIAALNGQYLYDTQKIGLKIKSILMTTIYEKSLKLKTSNNADVTLLTLDSGKFIDLLPNLHLLWSGPLIIMISIVGLLAVLGWSALAGVLVMAITIYSTKVITEKLRVFQKDLMDCKDPRISTTNEALGMMKQIKFFCWEDLFQQRIERHRQRELQSLKRIVYWDISKYMLGVISPFMVSLASFAVMILVGDASLLTLESVFVSIVLFNILKYPLSVIPNLSSTWTAVRASIDRINTFLEISEIKSLPRQTTSAEGARTRNLSETFESVLEAYREVMRVPIVSMRDASFTVGDKLILNSIDVQIQKGSFVAITGVVGSGKSSMLAAIMGELDYRGDISKRTESLAYVSQEPWVQHRSIKDNILFGKVENKRIYDQVIDACELGQDLATFTKGDETVIGEKGVTISGGQKQRIVLARAIYQQADLYLLDDPLSSVDGVVSSSIYEKVFGENGILAGKTIVLVAQDQEQLKNANTIYVMENGQIAAEHTYDSFKAVHCQRQKSYKREAENSVVDEIQDEEHFSSDRKLDTMKIGRISPIIYFKYFTMLGWCSMTVILLINVAIPVLDIYSTIWLAKWSTIDHQSSAQWEDFYLGIYSIFIFCLALFLSLNSAATTVKGISVSKKLHQKLLSNTIRQSMTFFDSTSSGQIMNRFSSDLDVVDSRISINFRDFLTNLSSAISILILFCLNTSNYIAIVLVIIVIIYFYLLKYHLGTSRQLKRLSACSNEPIILHFNESREGRSTIRAFRQEERFLNEFMEIVDRHQYFSYLYQASCRWLGIRLEIIGAVIIYFVAMLAVHNVDIIGASNVGVSISYALRLIPLLNALVRTTASLEENATSLERIEQFVHENTELQLMSNELNRPANWPSEGKIEFVNFNMDYSARRMALQDITLTIEGHEKIGIVGRTGAGKSSLISSLFRLYPLQSKGTIKIDGININQVHLEQLRKSLTIIPQSPLLFSGTLRQNLDPFNNHSNDAELWRALDLCKLKQLVASFPQQLSTCVGDRESNLSLGQKQLLCLARGILRDSKIVILDEATSAMDPETEKVLQQVLQKAFQNCTVLTIAHRQSTIQQVDRVLHMDQGRVVKLDRRSGFSDVDLMKL